MRAAKSSTDSPSLNVSVSNSRRSVCALAFCTRSTPTYRVLSASHAALAVVLLAMLPRNSSGTALHSASSALRSSVKSSVPTLMASHRCRPWSMRRINADQSV
uniref:Uncharacterized protein n=1 Tax=Arundo donax TaxID=35708 RepID=A0A0A8Z9R7_ARUDO